MTKKEIIEQLESLKYHCESMESSDDIWKYDAAALEYAINKLLSIE